MSKWGKKRIRKPLLMLFCICLFSVALLVWTDTKIAPVIKLVAEQRVHLTAVRLINEAVEEEMLGQKEYEQLVTIEKNEAGYITLVQPNSIAISLLSNKISQNVEEKLRVLSDEGISIPGGVISGMTLLANLGPPVKVGITPVGQVDVSISDEFISVGINQSKHRLNLNIDTLIHIAVPFDEEDINVTVALPLVETIIVGPVPNTYLQFGK